MRSMRWGALGELSPLGILAVGLVVGTAGIPVIKKGLRTLAFMTAKGVISTADHVKDTGEKLSREWKQMVDEIMAARDKQNESIKTGLQGAGVGMAGTGLGLSEKARGKIEDIKEEWKELVEEARSDTKKVEEKNDNNADPVPPSVSAAEQVVENKRKKRS